MRGNLSFDCSVCACVLYAEATAKENSRQKVSFRMISSNRNRGSADSYRRSKCRPDPNRSLRGTWGFHEERVSNIFPALPTLISNIGPSIPWSRALKSDAGHRGRARLARFSGLVFAAVFAAKEFQESSSFLFRHRDLSGSY